MAGFKGKFANNILITGFYNYSAQAISLLSTTIHSRLLTPSEYGVVAMVSIFIGLISIFADSGISYAIIRTDYGRRFSQLIHNFSILVGWALFILSVLISPVISYFFNNDSSLILPTSVIAFTFVIRARSIVSQATLIKKLATKFIGKVNLIVAISQSILIILFAYIGFSFWSLIIPQLIGVLILNRMFVSKASLSLQFKTIKEGIKGYFITKTLINNSLGYNIINYSARKTDNLLIGKLYGKYELGLYDRAYLLLSTTINLISNVFGSVLLPSLKELMPDKELVRKEYKDIIQLFSIATIPVAVILIYFGEELTLLLWGESWIEVNLFLPYIGLLILTQVIYSNAGYLFILFEKEKIFFRIGLASSIVLVSAITIGAFYSALCVIQTYCFAYIFIVLPIYAYFGYYKAFDYQLSFILKFWIPKISLSALIFIGELSENMLLVHTGIILYLLFTFAENRNQIVKGVAVITKKYYQNGK